MRRISFLLLFLCAGAAYADPPMDATMSRGNTQTFTVPFTYSVQTFSVNTPLVLLVTASPELTLGAITVPGFGCPLTTPNVITCFANTPGTAGPASFNVTQTLSVNQSASRSAGSWTIQLIGEALSGLLPKSGVITIHDPTPNVVMTKVPFGLLRAAGEIAADDTFVLKNEGDADATDILVRLAANAGAGLLLVRPGVLAIGFGLTLAPGEETTVGINESMDSRAQHDGGGLFVDELQVTGTGVDPTLAHVGVLLRVTPRPTQAPAVQPEKNRFDTSGSASGPLPTGIITFTNTGNGVANGIVSSDTPAVKVPNDPSLSLQPGESKAIIFTVNVPSIAPFGMTSITSKVTFRFLQPSTGKTAMTRIAPLADPPGTGSVSVTLVSTVSPTASTATIPPLTSIHDELFLAGVGHAQGSVGLFISDLTLYPQVMRSNPSFRNLGIPNIDVYYTPLGGGTTSKFTLASVSPPNLAAMGDFISTVYGANAQIGSLQIRTPGYAAGEGALGVNTNVFNVSGKTGTFGTAVPVFKFGAFECTQDANKKLYLTGLRKDMTGHTNFYIQETCGTAAKVALDFYDPNGNKIGSTTADVPAFAATQLGASVIPTGAVSAIVSHVAGTGGGFVAYATPVDELSGDTWAQVDWPNQRGYQGNVPVIIPVAGATPGANNTYFRTDVSIMNTGSTAGSGTLRFYNRTGDIIDKTITLDPLHTATYVDVTTNLFGITTPHVGYLAFTPSSGTFVLTSRNYSTPVGSNATFGTAVPTLAVTSAMTPSLSVRRIGGIEDASPDTVATGRGATFRTNFGLIETSGQPVTVKVTVYYNYTSSLTSTVLGATQTFNLTPNQFLLQGLGTIFGSTRASVGDLHNATIEFEIIGGTGKVIPFVSTVDNGSGDSTFRSE